LLPSIGFYVDFTDPFLLTINIAVLSSICWYGYLELKLEGYWATMFEFDSTKLLIGLDIQRQYAGRTTHTIKVKRVLTVFRCQIFYSEVMHTEALNFNKEEIQGLIAEEDRKKISDQENKLQVFQAEIKQLETELNYAHTKLESSEKRIRKALRQGFVMRGKFEGEKLFKSESVYQNLLDSGTLKLALGGFLLLIAMWVILPYVSTFEFPGLPEISFMWQMIIFATLIFGTILIFAVVIIKAWKAT